MGFGECQHKVGPPTTMYHRNADGSMEPITLRQGLFSKAAKDENGKCCCKRFILNSTRRYDVEPGTCATCDHNVSDHS